MSLSPELSNLTAGIKSPDSLQNSCFSPVEATWGSPHHIVLLRPFQISVNGFPLEGVGLHVLLKSVRVHVRWCLCARTHAHVWTCMNAEISWQTEDIDWQTVKINNWTWIIWHQTNLSCHISLLHPCYCYFVPSFAVLAFCWFPYVILL